MTKRRNVPQDVYDMLLAITKVFYDPNHSSLINLLVFHTHLTESELVDLLGFDYNTLRSLLIKLKADKLIEMKMVMTTDQDGKLVNKSFYFINFKQAINSFMYRLECCYKKLEEAQRQDISSGDYKCKECGDTYQDLDILDMYNHENDCIYCCMCHGLVEAIEDKDKRHSAREEIARFNTKIRNPFIEQFKKIKEQNLADDMIRPEIKQSSNNVNNPAEGDQQSGKIIKSDEIMVNLNSTATWNDNFGKERESKENPSWISSKVANNFMTNHFQPDSTDASNQSYSVTQTMAPGRVPGALTTINSSTPSTDIMGVLLANEYALENSLKFLDPLSMSLVSAQTRCDGTVSVAKDANWLSLPFSRFNVSVRGVVRKVWDLAEDDLQTMIDDDLANFISAGEILHDACYDS